MILGSFVIIMYLSKLCSPGYVEETWGNNFDLTTKLAWGLLVICMYRSVNITNKIPCVSIYFRRGEDFTDWHAQ